MSVYLSRLKRLWCSHMHSQIAWPVDGMYECRKCHELYAVPWEPGIGSQRRSRVEDGKLAI